MLAVGGVLTRQTLSEVVRYYFFMASETCWTFSSIHEA